MQYAETTAGLFAVAAVNGAGFVVRWRNSVLPSQSRGQIVVPVLNAGDGPGRKENLRAAILVVG